ncbi:kinase-like protein [Rhizophagus irregularis]|uniref:Kinase-like protein n=1 Tax=Rhizophagus irregularis TaxID=588596 RepID=A0A2I1H667_9GLOM|nr:kinase-like protein [Rhizophagus irregularis]
MDNDLNKYLRQNHNKLTWKERINIICEIIKALYEIHKEKAIHRDLHSGNILYLQSVNLWCISDLGFCGPVDKPLTSVYGNLPYIAPEVICGKQTTFASDIYSIAILMWEVSSGYLPFIDYKHHDYELAMNIIDGIRPEIIQDTPLEYEQLMKQCWDSDPLKRPDIDRLYNIIFEIRNLYYQNGSNKSYDQPFHKYNINLYQFFQSNKSRSFKTDYGSRSITSKFYNFEHLSSLKPKNATEEEQRAFHSKPYAFNLSDSNNSSALKIEKYFKDLSKNLTNKFKKLKINSKNNDNRNENELLQQETNNYINTNHYNMISNSINLSETKMEEDISAYSSRECSSRAFSFNISDW